MLKYRLLERAWFSRKDAVGVGSVRDLFWTFVVSWLKFLSQRNKCDVWFLLFHSKMLTDSSAQEDQQCNAAKLLEVTILQCRGHMDQVQYCLAHGKCNAVVAVCCTCTGLESSKILLNTFGVAKASKRLHVSLCICIYIYLSVCLFIYLVVASFLCGSCTGKIDEGGEGEWITNNVFTSGKGEYKNHARCNLI